MKTKMQWVVLYALAGIAWGIALSFVARALDSQSDLLNALGLFGLILLIAAPLVHFFPVIRDQFRSIGKAFGLLVVVISTSGCAGCVRIPPGYVGIKVHLAGADKGVQSTTAITGWAFYNPIWTQVFKFPVFVQTAQWAKSGNEEISFNSKDGMIITADVSLSYQLKAEKVPEFYVKFRTDDINAFTHGYMRNVARDQFNDVTGTYPVEDIYGPKKEEVIIKVKERINLLMEPMGIHIEQFGFIGAPRPPQSVIEAINAKINATQNAMRTENELRQAEAQAKKDVAKATGEAQAQVARAEGEAKANKVLAESITANLIAWRELSIKEDEIRKWNGVKPQVMAGQGTSLLIAPKFKE